MVGFLGATKTNQKDHVSGCFFGEKKKCQKAPAFGGAGRCFLHLFANTLFEVFL